MQQMIAMVVSMFVEKPYTKHLAVSLKKLNADHIEGRRDKKSYAAVELFIVDVKEISKS